MNLLIMKMKDNTVGSREIGTANDYPFGEYTQVSGSATRPKVDRNYLTILGDDIVSSHEKLWAGEIWTIKKESKRTEKSVNDIMRIENANLNIRKNIKGRMIGASILKNTVKKMLTRLMSLIENHISRISNGMMIEEKKCSENTLKSTEPDLSSDSMLKRERLFGLINVQCAERIVNLALITKIIFVHSTLNGSVGNAIR